MSTLSHKYFTITQALSYNSIFYFIYSTRNIGKTWALKMRALMRFIKHGKKTTWVRRFKSEIDETMQKHPDGTSGFFPDKMLKLLKVDASRIMIRKNKLYYNISKTKDARWLWFIEFIPLASQQKYKSVDDEKIDTIVFDEFTASQSKYNQYKGNEVNDFFNLFVTKMRDNKIRCFFLGNKESFHNPYFNALGIETPKIDFNGIRTYKDGTILIWQINDYLTRGTDYEQKVKTLFTDTFFHDFLYGGQTNIEVKIPYKTKPSGCIIYLQFLKDNIGFTIYRKAEKFYIEKGVDRQQTIYTFDVVKTDYRTYIISSSDRKFMSPLREAYRMFRIYPKDSESYEAYLFFVNNMGF